MKTETHRTNKDVTTAFGFASGGAISPPETDYPTETWEVVVHVEDKDSREEHRRTHRRSKRVARRGIGQRRCHSVRPSRRRLIPD